MMDQTFFANCLRASKAGLDHYTDAESWGLAMERLAKARKLPHESDESAFARLLDSDDEMKGLDVMRRRSRAVNDPGGRPRGLDPKPPALRKAEIELAEMALVKAYREGTSYERAFVAVLETDEGRALFAATRQ